MAKVFHFVFKLQQKPVADTGLIHYARVVLVPKSANNKRNNALFKKTRAAMLITTFDGGMIPYFLAFWQNRAIRRIFSMLKFFAVYPPPKKIGDEYHDYANFQSWLLSQNVVSESFYCAFPQTLQQIYHHFPEQKPENR
jgi:hypothetical protein